MRHVGFGHHTRLNRIGRCAFPLIFQHIRHFPMVLMAPSAAVRSYVTSEIPQHVAGLEEMLPNSLRCPECGKHFMSATNLLYHRRTRHMITIISSAQEKLDRLREENARLRAELQQAHMQHRQTTPNQQPMSGTTAGELDKTQRIFPAAVPEGKALGISMAEVHNLREHPFRVGTGCSGVRCVGVVSDDVEVGHLGRHEGGTESGLEVLQFTLKLEGYRQRRTGRLMMYNNLVTVRLMSPQYRVEKGDVVLVIGNYGLHRSFDLISKQSMENCVLEAGYIGLLKRGSQAGNSEYTREDV
ncbi:hypothetical protein, conserved [Trypanosoma brucei gambiense DAL972]|uniref:C2H2-type domain-containing protein n=1 Tax=Trypanosoma brucei gambiense (strain MHOM/CI/86/DAL972) TaxID=679716 RepID=C9ZXN4_TRYB9|nr:hypothetical protein, conserved [Trypanosoma brucei gambiense DAL972]CBH14178.1 hypothetical protein, conserved [Trypanosoma brucei gambiense DAL972]|eukprot:XP_011776449.1 hypothetical protein, conserved [Trypanosoma brucei gambiense DAL972]